MTLIYTISTIDGSLRTQHKITIDGETFVSTRAKEVLKWAKPRIFSKFDWKMLKDAVRLGEHLTINGGPLLGNQ